VVNKAKYDALPEDLKQVIAIATQAEHDQGLAGAKAGNAKALNTLITEQEIQIRQLPQDMLITLRNASDQVISDVRSSGDDLTKRTIDSFRTARQLLMAWSDISEQSFLAARALQG
jgi:TRAP-type mannitol/chloroaromatic compound transport system substrate-binding protein